MADRCYGFGASADPDFYKTTLRMMMAAQQGLLAILPPVQRTPALMILTMVVSLAMTAQPKLPVTPPTVQRIPPLTTLTMVALSMTLVSQRTTLRMVFLPKVQTRQV